jgi:L-fuculose-phosphate aldolase
MAAASPAPAQQSALPAHRESLVAFGRRLAGDDLAEGTSGNLSARVGDLIAITPSGVPYDDIAPADICLVRLADGAAVDDAPVDGAPVEGAPVAGAPVEGISADGRRAAGRRPSTETPMHLAVYRATDAGAVVHTHSPYVVALSTVLDELPAVHYAMSDLGGLVRVAGYARFGTPQLAENAIAALAGRTAVILRNHGALTYGPTLARAYNRAQVLEWLARVYWYARLAGTPRTLDEDALTEVREAARAIRYGEIDHDPDVQ